MAKIKKLGSIKRFGARYGRKVKHKFGKIEQEQRKLHKCPYCNYVKVKRVAAGIWECRKCNAKFTGKAYSIKKKMVVEEELPKVEKSVEEESSKIEKNVEEVAENG